MEIKLIYRKTDSILESYDLSMDEFKLLVKNMFDKNPKSLTNTYEDVIPFVCTLEDETIECAADIFKLLEEVEINNAVDLIETICNVEKDVGKKYMEILFSLKKHEIDMARNTMSYLVDDALEKIGDRLASIKIKNLK